MGVNLLITHSHLTVSLPGVAFLTLTIMASGYSFQELNGQEEKALEKISTGTNQFALKLFKELGKNNSGNLFVSPLSVQMVLALAYTGAKGDTAKELATLLSLPETIEDIHLGYKTLIKVLQDPVLKLANRMFVETTAGVKKEFQTNAKEHFQAPAELVNFREDPEKSRQHINAWVEDQTNKKIKDLLAQGSLDNLTRLVLVNAIHFKANWKLPFKTEDTIEEPFHVSKTQTVPVQMMHIKKKFGFTHSEELKAKVLELEYEGMHFRMLIILPDEIDGLAEVESKLEKVNLGDLVRYLQQPTVTVSLPKFKLEETMELKQILKNLGAASMFNAERADFSGLSDESLVVSKVVQKAFVEVNEKGTEAAAATGMSFCLGACPGKPPSPEEFIADHPFLFFISRNRSNTTLFFGRYKSPA